MKRIAILLCLTCFFLAGSHAQLWTGSVGDAVVNVDFGSGPNGGPQLPIGQTSYLFSKNSCPRENEYSLINFTFGCFQDSWHPLIGDHTPADQDGYNMLVNSANVKGDLLVYTVKGLCPNTRYEFAAWIKNMVRKTACNGSAIDPDLQFSVETPGGVTLQTYNTGNIQKENDAAWRQFGTTFLVSNAHTDVVLRITNIAASGCGNAFAVDDITVRPCGPELSAIVQSNNMEAVEVCEGSSNPFLLTANYGTGYSNPVFQWQLRIGQSWANITGATSKNYLRPPTGKGIYEYRVLVAQGQGLATSQCLIGSNTLTITVLPTPFVQATGYVYGCLDGEVTLLASGASNYVWTGPNGFTSASQRTLLPKVQYRDSGLYKVTGTTNFGCVHTDSTWLSVFPKATATGSGETSICQGASIGLNASGGTTYYWEPRATLNNETLPNPIATPLETTRYFVRVTNQFGCSDTTSVQINVWKTPKADAGPDIKTRLGLPQVLRGSASGSDVSWFWTPAPVVNTRHLLTPSVNPPQTTRYTLHVVSPHGCGTSTDDVQVKVFEKVIVPNAFSPNGDGINDTWYIEPMEFFPGSATEVYNRFGQLVYRSKGYIKPWDGTSNGTPMPVGTYYYVLDMGIQNQPKLTGSVTILR